MQEIQSRLLHFVGGEPYHMIDLEAKYDAMMHASFEIL